MNYKHLIFIHYTFKKHVHFAFEVLTKQAIPLKKLFLYLTPPPHSEKDCNYISNHIVRPGPSKEVKVEVELDISDSNSPLPENKWWSYAQVCPGGCWSFELIGAFKLGQLTLWALGVISIKFLLVISMLCKTAWSWELRTRSHKMNFLDILSTSPHYFCRKWIGERNENLNFDLRI